MDRVINLIYSDNSMVSFLKRAVEVSGLQCLEWSADSLKNDHYFSGATIILPCALETAQEDFFDKFRSFGVYTEGLSDEHIGTIEQRHNFVSFLSHRESPFFRNSLKTFFELSSIHMVEEKIDNALEIASKELQRVKKFHEKLVPMRQDSFKGIEIVSKFSAGESSGGEFFDFFESERKIVILMTQCNSYLLSSSVLLQMEMLKSKGQYSMGELENLATALMQELSLLQESSRKKLSLSLCFAVIDRASLDVEGHVFGEFDSIGDKGDSLFYSNKYPLSQSFFEKSYFKSKMQRGGKYFFVSPGVHMNTGDRIEGESIMVFLRETLKENGANNVINELFYQMKKNTTSTFLEYDATVISLEVKDNVIVQV